MEKYINIARPSAPPFEEYMAEIAAIWDSRLFTNINEKHNQLENELCTYLGTKNVSLFANGHSALETALQSLNLKGEVITTPFTFASTPLAITRSGLTPVFCDINETYCMNADLIENLITEKTCAILPVHLWGNICDVEKISEISKKYNIPVIYDAAQAFGIKKNEKHISDFGDISMFSFHAAKVFHTIEGGCLVYKNNELKKIFSEVRNFGICNEKTIRIGANFKMSEIHAAMGICNLRHLNEYIKKRKICVERYNEFFSGRKGLYINQPQKGVETNYSYYPLRVVKNEYGQSRDELHEKLARNNINARKYYYPLVSQFPIYDDKYNLSDTPVASCIAEQIIVLPLYSDMSIEDIDRICKVILE